MFWVLSDQCPTKRVCFAYIYWLFVARGEKNRVYIYGYQIHLIIVLILEIFKMSILVPGIWYFILNSHEYQRLHFFSKISFNLKVYLSYHLWHSMPSLNFLTTLVRITANAFLLEEGGERMSMSNPSEIQMVNF